MTTRKEIPASPKKTAAPARSKAVAAAKRAAPGKSAATRASSAPTVHVRPVDGSDGGSLVNQAVDALRRAVLAAPGPDVFLGSEEDLIAALGVSRPTFRQAAKLLRHENLLTIKRGMGGGFFTLAPSGEAVSRMAAIYLNALGTTMRQLNDVIGPLQAEAARLVARNPDREVRKRLADLLQHYDAEEAGDGESHPLRRMLAFERLLAELAQNPAIALLMQVMRDLLRDERHSYFKITPERVASYAQFQRRLAQAVLDGDAEVATLVCERFDAEVRVWLPDDRVGDTPR